jgi:hypothetical protein
MKIYNQLFVILSDLFYGLKGISTAFHDSDHSNITWGDANRTMIDKRYFVEWLDYSDSKIPQKELDEFGRRLKILPEDCLIDLEN